MLFRLLRRNTRVGHSAFGHQRLDDDSYYKSKICKTFNILLKLTHDIYSYSTLLSESEYKEVQIIWPHYLSLGAARA